MSEQVIPKRVSWWAARKREQLQGDLDYARRRLWKTEKRFERKLESDREYIVFCQEKADDWDREH